MCIHCHSVMVYRDIYSDTGYGERKTMSYLAVLPFDLNDFVVHVKLHSLFLQHLKGEKNVF